MICFVVSLKNNRIIKKLYLEKKSILNWEIRVVCSFEKLANIRSVKSVQIRSYLWSVFSCIRTEYGDLGGRESIKTRIYTNQVKGGTINVNPRT